VYDTRWYATSARARFRRFGLFVALTVSAPAEAAAITVVTLSATSQRCLQLVMGSPEANPIPEPEP
jgi:hypothetical protein